MTKGKRFLYLLIALLSFTSCVKEGGDDSADTSLVHVGDRVPLFSVTLNNGTVFNSAELGGVWTMIVFFNTSCADCQRELVRINAIYEDPSAREALLPTTEAGPGKIICIAREESAETIEQFWTDHSLSLPYSPQPNRYTYSLFALSTIPRAYKISPDGFVIWVQ